MGLVWLELKIGLVVVLRREDGASIRVPKKETRKE